MELTWLHRLSSVTAFHIKQPQRLERVELKRPCSPHQHPIFIQLSGKKLPSHRILLLSVKDNSEARIRLSSCHNHTIEY